MSASIKYKMDFIDLKAQQFRIGENLKSRMDRVLSHGQYIMGPEVQELEEKLASYVGVKHCISCGNGTDALQIAMMAFGVGPGDEVITTPFSFFATVETILLLGAKPVFVDIDPETYNLNPGLLEQAISSKTKLIVPVSLYGECADFDAINRIALAHKLPVLEDAAQSFGAIYKTKKSCALSDIATTSFFPSKPLGGYGDGGAVFTDNAEWASVIREIRSHGQKSRYRHVRVGVNSRLDTLQAAILLAKFEVFEDEMRKRSLIAARYENAFSSRFKLQKTDLTGRSSFAQFTIAVSDRDLVVQGLAEAGIPTAVHYPEALHRQAALKGILTDCPQADLAAQQVLSLPFSPYIRQEDQDYVIEALNALAKIDAMPRAV